MGTYQCTQEPLPSFLFPSCHEGKEWQFCISFLFVPEKWKNGDLCGPAEFCFSRLYCHKKQARSVFFSKYPSHVYEDCQEAKKERQKLSETSKKNCLFQVSLPSGSPNWDKRSLQKKPVQLTLSGRRSINYKVPPHIWGHHFLLCQQTNTKDIEGQSIHHQKKVYRIIMVFI